jgi:choline dehydrogenase-like flavoprotein
MSTTFDVVIVGSGFGGAVMAARIGAWAKESGNVRVLVLEKGRDHTRKLDAVASASARADDPPGPGGTRFRHSLDPRYVATVAELFTDQTARGRPTMNVLAGTGLGGGSNVYDGVSLRAPTVTFEQTRADRRLWPKRFTRAALDPFYARVEEKLRVHRMEWTDARVPHWQLATKRDFVFAEGCHRIGAAAVPLKLADDNDANEGWWNQGQVFEGRQGLVKNYLADAKAAGVELRSGCEVSSIAPSGKGYVVRGTDRRTPTATPFEIECRLLVVASGAVASTALLLRSRTAFEGPRALDASAHLGKDLSANGDYGVTGMVGPAYARTVEAHKGKPMSSFSPSYWKSHGFILIPFHADPLYLALGRPSTLLRPSSPRAFARGTIAPAPGERDFGLDYKKRLADIGPRLLTMGCLALDACEGEIRLGPTGRAEAVWPKTMPETEARWRAAVETMQRIYTALGGEMFLDGYRKDGTVSTAHPLGGCRMTERDAKTEGVVDPFGETFGNPNLFVIDGAILPSALGVNPSLTIAAVAESIADAVINGRETQSLRDRLA